MCGYREMKIYVYTEEEKEFSDAEKQEGRDISAL
jgi:hypothetical protein